MRVLIIVEQDFLSTHVGVRQVIFYYINWFKNKGGEVTLASPQKGELLKWENFDILYSMKGKFHPDNEAVWCSTERMYRPGIGDSQASDALRPVMSSAVNAELFDYSLISTPWLCAAGLPEFRYSAGIVYDMVPNLIACGALSLGRFVDAFSFARLHDVGYQFYLKNCEKILAISANTSRDFQRFYLDPQCIVDVIVPFEFRDRKTRFNKDATTNRLLLVNVLDERKNFRCIERAFSRGFDLKNLSIDIVGMERLATSEVLRFCSALADAGIDVRWFRKVSDEFLDELYATSDLLIFPSFYEGLGLPILEAQAQGLPVISSDTSSCIEMNMNTSLCIAPESDTQLLNLVHSVCRDEVELSKGDDLRCKLHSYLSTQFPHVLV